MGKGVKAFGQGVKKIADAVTTVISRSLLSFLLSWLPNLELFLRSAGLKSFCTSLLKVFILRKRLEMLALTTAMGIGPGSVTILPNSSKLSCRCERSYMEEKTIHSI